MQIGDLLKTKMNIYIIVGGMIELSGEERQKLNASKRKLYKPIGVNTRNL